MSAELEGDSRAHHSSQISNNVGKYEAEAKIKGFLENEAPDQDNDDIRQKEGN